MAIRAVTKGGLAVLLAAVAAAAGLAGAAQAQARFGGFGRFEPVAYQARGWERERGYDRGRYGPPGYYAPRGYVPPPQGYGRGQVLPPDYRERYVEDPGRYHLRAPPSGYGWVGDGRNAYLMQRSTGMVLDAVPRAYEPPPRYESRGRGRGRERR
jgi:Ni/Co efflux regulator RcnB